MDHLCGHPEPHRGAAQKEMSRPVPCVVILSHICTDLRSYVFGSLGLLPEV